MLDAKVIILVGSRDFGRCPLASRLPAALWSVLGRPALERLQQMGVTFENHQICAAVCTPSRSTIYTGQHIVHTGMFDNTNFPWQEDMSTDIPTMGARMRQAGHSHGSVNRATLHGSVSFTGSIFLLLRGFLFGCFGTMRSG